MKKLLLLPVIIFPYILVLGVLLGELFPEDIAPIVFGVFVILFALATPICNIIFMIVSKKDDPYKLIRMALFVKLVHIPSYVMVFLFGLVASLMIFMTFPLVLMCILFDVIVLLFSSSVSVFALVQNTKQVKALSIVALIFQFFFCADVISLLVLNGILKNRARETVA